MKLEDLDIKCFLKPKRIRGSKIRFKTQNYFQKPYHLRSLVLNFENMCVENSIVYNYTNLKKDIFSKRETEYFIEVTYLTLDNDFVISEKLKNYLIEVLKNQILLSKEQHRDLSLLKREIKQEKFKNKINKLKQINNF